MPRLISLYRMRTALRANMTSGWRMAKDHAQYDAEDLALFKAVSQEYAKSGYRAPKAARDAPGRAGQAHLC